MIYYQVTGWTEFSRAEVGKVLFFYYYPAKTVLQMYFKYQLLSLVSCIVIIAIKKKTPTCSGLHFIAILQHVIKGNVSVLHIVILMA